MQIHLAIDDLDRLRALLRTAQGLSLENTERCRLSSIVGDPGKIIDFTEAMLLEDLNKEITYWAGHYTKGGTLRQ